MLRSVICIHFEGKCELATIASRDYFITVYIHIKDAILKVGSKVNFGKQEFSMGLEEYIAVLGSKQAKCKIQELELSQLYQELETVI